MNDSPELLKVRLALKRLAQGYPLHAGILARWRIDADASVGTMGVGCGADGLRLVFAPAFVSSISMSELEGVLLHEVNHVLFGHVLHKPPPDENREARLIAEEVTVNEWIAEPLPGDPVLLSQHPYLPANEDTDTRYKRIAKRMGGKARRPKAGGNQSPPDNHDTWAEIQERADEASDLIHEDVSLVWSGMSPQQRETLPEAFQNPVVEACAQSGLGTAPGNDASTITGGAARMRWQSVLRRYVGSSQSRRRVFSRPPRRFPDMVGIIPGSARSADQPRIMAVIDTSGSMNAKTLADISCELGVMSRHYEVIVVECDAEIHAVYPWKPIKALRGRGGTSFCPPFERPFLRKHHPDLVVYFTDGCGRAPEHAPNVPVIWCLTDGGNRPANWGREIHLTEPESGTC